MGFSRQQYWSGLPCSPPPGDLPKSGIETRSSTLQGDYLSDELPEMPIYIYIHVIICIGFPNGSAVKNPPARQETRETKFQSLGQEDPLKEEMSTSVFLPGKFHGQRSLAGWSPWGLKESDMTEHACMHIITHLGFFLYKWDCALYCILFWIVLLFI